MTNWKYSIPGFQYLITSAGSKEEPQTFKKIKPVIRILETHPAFKDLDSSITKGLRAARTFYKFNKYLTLVYDFADDHNIWLGLGISKEI